MRSTLCLLQDPWISFVDGKSLLTVEAFVIYNESFNESQPVVLTAVGEAADVAANYSSVGKLVEVEMGEVSTEWSDRLSKVEDEYRRAYEMTPDNKTVFATAIELVVA